MDKQGSLPSLTGSQSYLPSFSVVGKKAGIAAREGSYSVFSKVLAPRQPGLVKPVAAPPASGRLLRRPISLRPCVVGNTVRIMSEETFREK